MRNQWKRYLAAGLVAVMVAEIAPAPLPMSMVSFAEMEGGEHSPSDATDSDATIWEDELENDLSSEYDPDFGKLITDVQCLHSDSLEEITEGNPIVLGEEAVFRFYYQLTDEMKEFLKNEENLKLEYLLPYDIQQLTDSYDELIGNEFYQNDENINLGYRGYYQENGLVFLDIFFDSTDEFSEEFWIDLPIVIDADCAAEVSNIIINANKDRPASAPQSLLPGKPTRPSSRKWP